MTLRPVDLRGALASRGALAVLLVAVLLGVNGLAIWNLVTARAEAERTAAQELALETQADARALEAALATLRGDFIFLSYSPPLTRPAAIPGGDGGDGGDGDAEDDPVTRRWSRLAIETALLLFLEAHPSVTRLAVLAPDGTPVAAVGWRQGMPVLLAPEAAERAPDDTSWHTAWPVGAEAASERPRAALHTWIDRRALLDATVPGAGERLSLEATATATPIRPIRPSGTLPTPDAEPTTRREGDLFVVRAAVSDPHWVPPVAWTLVRTEPADRLLGSVEALAGGYRATVVANLAIILLSLALGALAFRAAVTAARAAAESRHQAERAELERQLRHSDRLASIGRLTAGMAHEINNPLEGMINYLKLLDEDLAAGDTASARELAGRLREGLDRVAGIVRQALSFGEPGRVSRERVDLGRVVRETVAFVHQSPVADNLVLEVDLADEPGALTVFGNRTTLAQLTLNLVLNACQACDTAGGEVLVRGRRIPRREGAGQGEEDVVRLEVLDRGTGLAPEARDHLFEPFFSTRGSTGLGLAVVHGIVAEHGGSLDADNRPDGGARFTVVLPAEPVAAESEAP